MICSMTAFARHSVQEQWGAAVWEIRSVNHRYLEISLRLPDVLRELEPLLRERVRQKLQRGKVEIFLKYTPPLQQQALNLNQSLLQQLAATINQITTVFPQQKTINPMDILAWPGVLQTKEEDLSQLQQGILKAFDVALTDLMKSRKTEGAAIANVVQERLRQITQLVVRVKTILPTVIPLQRKKILDRLAEAKVNLDPMRLEQEMVLMAQKIDVTEEIDRLQIHIVEVKKALQQDQAAGRRLDFLMQEMHRESNTLASKSVEAEISAIAVDLRVLNEQIREQVQNIE